MKIRTRVKSGISLESVALTDIIMNLFIFFFISFSLLYTFSPHQESKINVNLPKGLTRTQLMGERPLIVTVSSKNEIYLGGELVDEKSLAAALSKRAGEAKENGVIVKADKRASVDFFVRVLDATKQAGINKVSVAIELNRKE
ncbi:MAG: biopolymer transporter ExbD [Spirochaetes bacterium]|nr:biopolymer transporter ExbD [Spirochaetota bacterium]